MGPRKILTVVWLALVLALLAPTLGATPTAADRATARELASEGHKALIEKDFQTASDRFRRANELFPAPTLLVGYARAQVGLEKFVEAQEAYLRVTRNPPADDAPESWKEAHADAARELNDIQPRLAWLTITVPGVSEPAILLNGRRLSAAAVGVRRAANPGDFELVVGADGHRLKRVTGTLEEGDSKLIEVVLTPGRTEALPEVTSEADSGAKDEAAPGRPPWLPYVAFGVGGAGLLAGTVFGVLTLGKKSTLDDVCPGNACPPEHTDTLSDYRTFGLISTIGFGVAIAGAGAGVVLWLTDPEREATADAGAGAGTSTGAETGTASVHFGLSGIEFKGTF